MPDPIGAADPELVAQYTGGDGAADQNLVAQYTKLGTAADPNLVAQYVKPSQAWQSLPSGVGRSVAALEAAGQNALKTVKGVGEDILGVPATLDAVAGPGSKPMSGGEWNTPEGAPLEQDTSNILSPLNPLSIIPTARKAMGGDYEALGNLMGLPITAKVMGMLSPGEPDLHPLVKGVKAVNDELSGTPGEEPRASEVASGEKGAAVPLPPEPPSTEPQLHTGPGSEPDQLRHLSDEELAAAHPLGTTPAPHESANAGIPAQAADAAKAMLRQGAPGETGVRALEGAEASGLLGSRIEQSVVRPGTGYKPMAQAPDIPAAKGEVNNVTPSTQMGALMVHPQVAPEIIRRAQALRGDRVPEGYEKEEAAVDAMVVNPQRLLEIQNPNVLEAKAMARVGGSLGSMAEDLRQSYQDAINAGKMDVAARIHDQIEAFTNQSALFYAKSSKGMSEAGRLFNFGKWNLGGVGRINVGAALNMARDVKRADLTDGEAAELTRLTQAHDISGVNRYISGLKRYTVGEQLETGWKDGLISGAGTVMRIGSTVGNVAINAATKPVRIAISDVLSGFSGVQSDLALPRSFRNAALRDATKMMQENMQKISRGETPTLGPGRESNIFGMGLEAQPFAKIPVVGPSMEALHDVLMRTHSGMHQLAGGTTFTYQFAIYERSLALAMQKAGQTKLSPDIRAEAWKIAQHPSAETQTFAAQRAWQYAYLNSNILSRAAGRAHQFAAQEGGAGGAAVEAATTGLLPFARISGNVIGSAAMYTPLGLGPTAVSLARFVKAVRSGVGESDPAKMMNIQAELTSRASRTAVGSVGLFGTGYYLASKGLMNGSGPQSPAEQKVWDAEGRSPYSFKWGKSWYSPIWLGAPGMALAMGAAAYHAAQGGAGPFSTVAQMAGPVARESFIPSMKGAAEALSPGRDQGRVLGRLGEEYAGSTVPNIVAEAERATDPFVRGPEGASQAIEARIPGLGERIPAKLGASGTPLQHETGAAAFGPDNYPYEPGAHVPQQAPTAEAAVRRATAFRSQMEQLLKRRFQITQSHQAGAITDDRFQSLMDDVNGKVQNLIKERGQ